MTGIPYTPSPIDTSDVELSDDLKQLVEQLARNVHDNWAIGRFNEAWTYGPVRNDELKQHPCLVDYDDLPGSEKEYDSNTVIETLKLILKLGWKVEKEAYQKTQRDHATIEDYISYIKMYGNTSFNNGNSKKK